MRFFSCTQERLLPHVSQNQTLRRQQQVTAPKVHIVRIRRESLVCGGEVLATTREASSLMLLGTGCSAPQVCGCAAEYALPCMRSRLGEGRSSGVFIVGGSIRTLIGLLASFLRPCARGLRLVPSQTQPRRVFACLLLCPVFAGAQQQGNAPPDSGNSPLVQPADVVQSRCPQPLAHVAPGSTVTSGDWVELTRTGCGGRCPNYTVRLFASGAVNWRGDASVAVIGSASAQVDGPTAANLIQQLRDHGFNALCGVYSRRVTDAEAAWTTVSVGGTSFAVYDKARSAPAWLRDFDDRVDAVADTHCWRHGEPAVELFGAKHLIEDATSAKTGRTRLMRAAATPNGAIALLLAQKVAIEAEDASGWTALMYAAGAGSLEQVRQLLAAGANASHASHAGETLLFAAAGSLQNPVGKLLLLQKAGANVAAVTNQGATVLMIAASRYQQPEILKAVLAMGADPSVRNQDGKTALDVLEQAGEQAGAQADTPAAYQVAKAMLLRAH